MAAELSKEMSRDISGEAWEEAFADLVGGEVMPGRGNRPTPDVIKGGIAYSVKTIALRPTISRPEPLDWLGEKVRFPITRIQPKAPLPKGRTLCDVTPQALGRRLILAYNEMIEAYGWDRQSFLARLRCDGEELWSYLYWEEPAEPIDPDTVRWTESKRDPATPWARNIRGLFVPKSPKSRGKTAKQHGDRPADILWTSSGSQLTRLFEIQQDADCFVVPDAKILTRQEATSAMLSAIQARLLSSVGSA